MFKDRECNIGQKLRREYGILKCKGPRKSLQDIDEVLHRNRKEVMGRCKMFQYVKNKG